MSLGGRNSLPLMANARRRRTVRRNASLDENLPRMNLRMNTYGRLNSMADNSKSNSPEPGGSHSGDDTDVSPPSAEPVTESGDFPSPWIEVKCCFCGLDLKAANEPKLLQCLHTACKSCLATESEANSAPTSSGLGLPHLNCPSCNQEINPNEVIDHLFLLEHISQNSEGLPEESKSYPCSCEEGIDATGFCTDCQEWLCEGCVTAHHRVRVTKDHIIRPKEEMEGEKTVSGLSQKYLFCPVHSHEALKLYCESCDKLTCRDCQLSDHKEHKYQFLTSACEDERNSLSMILGKIKEKQTHIEGACDLVNKRHTEITQRELAVNQEIKAFAVKFITEINKRGKQLLQELSDVCTEKKTQLSFKNQELLNMSQKLSFCKKFSEAALAHGSETALVYSKKLMIGQMKRILKHRCEVPNPSHNVDIAYSYEGNYLTQYISTLGTLMVDQQPVPRISLATPTPQQQSNNRLVQQQQPMHTNQNMTPVRQMNQQLVPVNRNLPMMNQQQLQMQQQKQQQLQMQKQQQMQAQKMQVQQMQQMQKHQQMQKQNQQYGQAQVTSSTDHTQNRVVQQGPLRQMMNSTNSQPPPTYNRVPMQQRTMTSNVSGNAIQNYAVNNNNFQQQQQQQQQQQRAIQQTPPRPSVQQQPQQQFNQQPQQQPALPQMLNSNITISPVGGPTPPKQQRSMPPRQNVQMTSATSQKNSGQRVATTPQNIPQQQQQRPQVIEIDGDLNKTPNMSNTSRLTHFPAAAQAAIAAIPGPKRSSTKKSNTKKSGLSIDGDTANKRSSTASDGDTANKRSRTASAPNAEIELVYYPNLPSNGRKEVTGTKVKSCPTGSRTRNNNKQSQTDCSLAEIAPCSLSSDSEDICVVKEIINCQNERLLSSNAKVASPPQSFIEANKCIELIDDDDSDVECLDDTLKIGATHIVSGTSNQKVVDICDTEPSVIKVGSVQTSNVVVDMDFESFDNTAEVADICDIPATSNQKNVNICETEPSAQERCSVNDKNFSVNFDFESFDDTAEIINICDIPTTSKQKTVSICVAETLTDKRCDTSDVIANLSFESNHEIDTCVAPAAPNDKIVEICDEPLAQNSNGAGTSDEIVDLNVSDNDIVAASCELPPSMADCEKSVKTKDSDISFVTKEVADDMSSVTKETVCSMSEVTNKDIVDSDKDVAMCSSSTDLCNDHESASFARGPEDSVCDSSSDSCPTDPGTRSNSQKNTRKRKIVMNKDTEGSYCEDEHEDFCAVCRDGGDLVCCSFCRRAYHNSCHMPALPAPPEGLWACGICEDVDKNELTDKSGGRPSKKGGIHGKDLLFCKKILFELFCHKDSRYFHLRVCKTVPNYYKIIKKPIELRYIKLKLLGTLPGFYSNVLEFVADVRLVVRNCQIYHEEGHHMFQVAETLNTFFNKLLKEYFPNIMGEEVDADEVAYIKTTIHEKNLHAVK